MRTKLEEATARLQQLESASNTKVAQQIVDPVTKLKRGLEQINSDSSLSVISYDVRKTDSVVSPLLAVVDVMLTATAQIKVGYRAFLSYQEERWTLKVLEKSLDRDGSMQAGRAKQVTKEDVVWSRVESYFEK